MNANTPAAGTQVQILDRGAWIGPYTVTGRTGRTSDHLVLDGPSGLFEHYNDAPYNTRPHPACPVCQGQGWCYGDHDDTWTCGPCDGTGRYDYYVTLGGTAPAATATQH